MTYEDGLDFENYIDEAFARIHAQVLKSQEVSDFIKKAAIDWAKEYSYSSEKEVSFESFIAGVKWQKENSSVC